jgi:hypothetical protein
MYHPVLRIRGTLQLKQIILLLIFIEAEHHHTSESGLSRKGQPRTLLRIRYTPLKGAPPFKEGQQRLARVP